PSARNAWTTERYSIASRTRSPTDSSRSWAICSIATRHPNVSFWTTSWLQSPRNDASGMNPPIFITSPKSFDRELFHFLINISISDVKYGEYRVGIMAGRVKEKARANPHRTPCEFNDLFPIRKDIPYDHWAYIPEKLERALL